MTGVCEFVKTCALGLSDTMHLANIESVVEAIGWGPLYG